MFQHHTAASYDRVAQAYAQQFKDELAHKPSDRHTTPLHIPHPHVVAALAELRRVMRPDGW